MLHLLLKKKILLTWCGRKHGMNPLPSHIATNQKAVAERGWGPLNYKLLLHPEIQLTSTSNQQAEANNNQPASSIPESGLNMSQCITATLVDQVVQYRNREDARNGIDLDKLARQQKEAVLRAIESNKER